jgi:small-conductance mechanosensitive channel
MDKTIIGFIIIYGVVLTLLPYLLYNHIRFTLFITYIANVDLIANVLSTSFPNYFKRAYDTTSNALPYYLSYNFITLYALSGIFLYGLNLKSLSHSDLETFKSMIAVAIITFTLPTLLIPYLTHYVNKLSKYIALNYIKGEHKTKNKTTNKIRLTNEVIDNISIIVSIVIACIFILLEGYFIENFIFVKTVSFLKGNRP